VAQLRFIPQSLPGVILVEPFRHSDARGEFVKSFHAAEFAEHNIRFEMREEFYSVSQRGVLRGMHFQTPPFAHQKVVTCLTGRVMDVVVDLRKASPTYGKHLAIELNAANRSVLYIPVGLAHGFLSLESDSCLVYKTDREHAPQNDAGIRWDSFGYSWPMSANDLVVSQRDQQHPPLADNSSPF
jgi:dTDP-4-dehydrorhamnose 3,5-epimerase